MLAPDKLNAQLSRCMTPQKTEIKSITKVVFDCLYIIPVAKKAGGHSAAHEAKKCHLLSEFDVGFSLGKNNNKKLGIC
jgi:hypothetical protein